MVRLSRRKRSFHARRLRERQQIVLPLLIGVNAVIFIGQLVVDLYQPGFVREYLGISNHGVSEALYLRDPDHNGIELYWDRPKEQWPRTPDGKISMYTRTLDLDNLMAEL